jgi:N,N-dimethylformamidase beta subunit-like, C-terminal
MLTLRSHISRGAWRRSFASLSVAALAATILGFAASAPVPILDQEQLEGRAPTTEELQASVEAAFPRESYRPGQTASLVFFNHARGVVLQILHSGPEHARTLDNNEMQGVPVTKPRPLGVIRKGLAVSVPIGNWASGLYFARLRAADGRVGFAPFVLRPRRLGEHRVAVVMPTMTWQAYNLRDDNGDGKGDTWYASWSVHTARLGRPFLNRGVPYNFRNYDLPFLHWLAQTRRQVDFLADADLDTVAGGRVLASAYDLIVFPGHHEYVTTHEYDAVEQFRNRGGNLMFLSANNFFWRIVKHGNVMERTEQWRDLGRPEAALIGVQYRGNDRGTHRGRWTVRRARADSWVFAGTGLRSGSKLGSAGIEIDKTATASPKNVQILADIPNLFGPGFTAQMTYYETRGGARVFAAGAFTLAGSIGEPDVRAVVENVWQHLTADGKQG